MQLGGTDGLTDGERADANARRAVDALDDDQRTLLKMLLARDDKVGEIFEREWGR